MTTSSPLALRGGSRMRTIRGVARSGYAVNGVLHLLIGGSAIGVAFGDPTSGEADQSGALQRLSDSPLGQLLLWAAVVGLLSLGVWQVVRAILHRERSFLKRWGRRFVEGGKGVIYLGIGATALVFALGGSTSSSEAIRRLSSALLTTQGGVWVLLAIGLTGVGAGIAFISIGVRRTFTKLIRVPERRGRRRAVLTLGLLGYVAKGIALALAGTGFVVTAITGDIDQASGLDGALRSLTELPFGVVALVLVGIGLSLYGVFLMTRSRLAVL